MVNRGYPSTGPPISIAHYPPAHPSPWDNPPPAYPSPWDNLPPAHPSVSHTMPRPTRLHGTTFHRPTRLHGTTFHRPTCLPGTTFPRPPRLYHTPCPGPPVSMEQLPTGPPVCLAPCSLAQIPWPIRLHHILHSLPIPSNTFLYYPILYTTGPSLSIGYTLYSGPLVYIATIFPMGPHGMARLPWYIVNLGWPSETGFCHCIMCESHCH